jgi:hypothetical protein
VQRRVRARATGDRSHYEIRTIIVTAVRRKENNQSDTELHGVRTELHRAEIMSHPWIRVFVIYPAGAASCKSTNRCKIMLLLKLRANTV